MLEVNTGDAGLFYECKDRVVNVLKDVYFGI
jgi:hypothetical protein